MDLELIQLGVQRGRGADHLRQRNRCQVGIYLLTPDPTSDKLIRVTRGSRYPTSTSSDECHSISPSREYCEGGEKSGEFGERMSLRADIYVGLVAKFPNVTFILLVKSVVFDNLAEISSHATDKFTRNQVKRLRREPVFSYSYPSKQKFHVCLERKSMKNKKDVNGIKMYHQK